MASQDTITSAGPAFDLSEDQQAVREMVRDFAESEIRPIAATIDETHDFPLETARKMGELGLMGMFVPEAYGGAGMDYVSYVIAIEELSRVCAFRFSPTAPRRRSRSTSPSSPAASGSAPTA